MINVGSTWLSSLQRSVKINMSDSELKIEPKLNTGTKSSSTDSVRVENPPENTKYVLLE